MNIEHKLVIVLMIFQMVLPIYFIYRIVKAVIISNLICNRFSVIDLFINSSINIHGGLVKTARSLSPMRGRLLQSLAYFIKLANMKA